MTRCIALALVALLVFLGCASGGASGGGADQAGAETLAQVKDRDTQAKIAQHVDASVSDTWKVLGPAFQDLNYKGGPTGNADEHIYATPWLRLPGRLYEGEANSTYFDCGRAPNGNPTTDTYELTFGVLVWVEPDTPTGSVIRVLVNGTGRDRTNPSATVACKGTGKLETAFMQAIQRRLRMAGK